jgi:hypothetical protein
MFNLLQRPLCALDILPWLIQIAILREHSFGYVLPFDPHTRDNIFGHFLKHGVPNKKGDGVKAFSN